MRVKIERTLKPEPTGAQKHEAETNARLLMSKDAEIAGLKTAVATLQQEVTGLKAEIAQLRGEKTKRDK